MGKSPAVARLEELRDAPGGTRPRERVGQDPEVARTMPRRNPSQRKIARSSSAGLLRSQPWCRRSESKARRGPLQAEDPKSLVPAASRPRRHEIRAGPRGERGDERKVAGRNDLRAAPAVDVLLPGGAEARVKRGVRFRNLEDPYVLGKPFVDGVAKGARPPRFRQVEVHHLTVRVDPRVGAAGSLDTHRGARDAPERVVENGLDGAGRSVNLQPETGAT